MYANDKAMAERWEEHTPKDKKLPEKVNKQTNKNAELKSGFKRNFMDVKTLAKQAVADTDKDVTSGLAKFFQPGLRQFADNTFSLDQNQIDRFSKANAGSQYVFGDKSVTPGRFKSNPGTTAMAAGGQIAGTGALGILGAILGGKFGKGLGRLVGGKFAMKVNPKGAIKGFERYSKMNPLRRAAVDQVDDILSRGGSVANRDLTLQDKIKDGLLGIGSKLDPEIIGSRSASRNMGGDLGQFGGVVTGGIGGLFGGQSLARKAMGPQEMMTQLPGYDEEGNRTLVQKVKDMFSSKEASDIEKLAYAAVLEKEAYLGTLGGGILGGAGGALMSEPGYRADSFGHGALRGAGAGAGAGIGGLAGLLAAYKMSRPSVLPTNMGGPASTSNSNKILQALLPLLGAAGGGVVGYGASKALGGESRLEKKRSKEEENEKEASLAVTFALINALRQQKGDKAEGFGRGFGTGLGTDLGAVAGGALGAATGALPAVLAGLLGGGYLGSKGAQKLMGPASYAKPPEVKPVATKKEASTIQELAKEAGKRGLWDNVHAKRERGEEPAEKGDKDYPDEKSWKKTTEASK